MEVGLVSKIDIDQEMQQAYLDYAMSVIIARALPDARDGLKPVHRRILYAMYDMGLRPDSAYKKSARIVGEVLGKYHPHGDMAVYDSMARMAQDFSLRYLLVDGQGNFGSVDGDPAAAMRYTEARLTSPAIHMLADIGKNTVNFSDNFDGTLSEPVVLPSAIPNLLVNGTTGIAVGMATSIPPHNMSEIIDAMQYLLENWEKLDDISIEDLMHFVQGPDFPTGGILLHEEGEEGLTAAYSTGRGRVTLQASAHLEEMERGRSRIIVTELPFMTNKASLIERIAELAREERLEGIVDLRDESDRQGMRIVIELNKTAEPQTVLRDLYKHTPMQSTFSIIMLALVEGEPRLLSLKQALRVYVEHRLEIVRRRSEYDLAKARQRAHILEGLRIALKYLDEIIDLIRRSPDTETAHARLMKKYKLSDIQAQAILDMPLKRLAALERKKIEDEYKELTAQIKELETLLRSPKKMRQVVSEELAAVKESFGDRRRTHIVQLKDGGEKVSLLTSTDLVPDKSVWISVTSDGLISRTLDEKPPRLSGKEAPAWLMQSGTRDTLYLVCEQGEAAALPVHALPESDSPANGIPLAKASALREGNHLAAMFCMPARSSREEDAALLENWFILTATRQGMVKKSPLSELPGPSANTFTLVRVNDGDRLGWLQLSNGQNEILLVTTQGMAIRFHEEEVRPMGLVAAGVMGMKLQEGDQLAGMELLSPAGEVFVIATDGSAKRIPASQFPAQGRYGQGVAAWKLPAQERVIGLTVGKGASHAILHLKKLAPKSIRLDEAPLQTRTARGAVIQEIKAGEQILRLTTAWEPPRPGGKIITPEKPKAPANKTKPAAAKKEAKPATPKASSSSKAKPAAAKEEAKPAAPKASSGSKVKPAAAKEEAKPAAPKASSGSKAKPAAAKEETKPAAPKASSGSKAKPAAAKEEAKPAAPKASSSSKAKPAAAKEEAKPAAPKASSSNKAKPAAAKEEAKPAAPKASTTKSTVAAPPPPAAPSSVTAGKKKAS